MRKDQENELIMQRELRLAREKISHLSNICFIWQYLQFISNVVEYGSLSSLSDCVHFDVELVGLLAVIKDVRENHMCLL